MSSRKKNNEFKIILADDHQVFRIGLRKLIEDAGFTVVAEASNGEELIEQIGKNEDCNMVITDLSMPKMNGLDAIDEIKSTSDDLKIMVLSMHKEREYFRKVLSKGVDGYLLKDDIFEKIVSAIKSVREGRKSYSDELTSFVMEDYAVIKDSEISLELLTKREKEVLVLQPEMGFCLQWRLHDIWRVLFRRTRENQMNLFYKALHQQGQVLHQGMLRLIRPLLCRCLHAFLKSAWLGLLFY